MVVDNSTTSQAFINNSTTNNSTTTNAKINNAYVDNSTTTNSFAVNAVATNATTTNVYITNANIDNSSTTDAFVKNAIITNSTTTELIATNATSTNLFTNVFRSLSTFIDNLSFSNATGTNITATGTMSVLGFTTLATTTVSSLTASEIVSANSTTTGSNVVQGGSTLATTSISDLTVSGSSTLNTVSANKSSTTDLLAKNATITELVITNATSTNFFTNALNTVTGYIGNLLFNNATGTNITATGTLMVTGTSVLATTTVSSLTASEIASSNATATNLVTTNATTANLVSTNSTSTNFFSNLLTAVSGYFTNLFTKNLTASTTNTTNLLALDATTTNLLSSNITATNTLSVTGTTVLATTTASNLTVNQYLGLNGGVKDSTGATGTIGQLLSSTGTSTRWITNSLPFNSITNALANGTLDNTNYAQTWSWSTATSSTGLDMNANGLTSGSLLSLTTNSGAFNSNNGILYVGNTGSVTNGTIFRAQSNSATGSGLTVLANGNVGIGTINPTTKLDVEGSIRSQEGLSGEGVYYYGSNANFNIGSAAALQAQVTNGTLTNASRFGVAFNGSGINAGYITVNRQNSSNTFDKFVSFENNNGSMVTNFYADAAQTKLMKFDSNGNLGIGTTNASFPLSFGNTLGNKIGLWDAGSGNGYGFGIQPNLMQIFSDGSGTRIGLGYGSSTNFTETLSVVGGKVGIGTTAPASQFSIVTSGVAAQSTVLNPNLTVGNNVGLSVGMQNNTGSSTALAYQRTATGGYGILETWGSVMPMVIQSGEGYVGIGTTTPTSKLSIAAAAGANAGISLFNSTTNQAGWIDRFANRLSITAPDLIQIGVGSQLAGTLALNSSLLSMNGDIKTGTSGTNGCLQNFAGTGIAGTCSSDERLKNITGDATSTLEGISNLDLINFKWNDLASSTYGHHTEVINTGFVAQAVKAQFPELVSVDNKGYYQVDYTTLGLYGLKAIKELNNKIFSKTSSISASMAEITASTTLPMDAKIKALGLNAQDINDMLAQLASSTSATTTSTTTTDAFGNNVISTSVTFVGKFIDRMIVEVKNFLANATDVFIKKVNTNEICVNKTDGSKVCITGDQLQNIMDNNKLGSAQSGANSSQINSNQTSSSQSVSTSNSSPVVDVPVLVTSGSSVSSSTTAAATDNSVSSVSASSSVTASAPVVVAPVASDASTTNIDSIANTANNTITNASSTTP